MAKNCFPRFTGELPPLGDDHPLSPNPDDGDAAPPSDPPDLPNTPDPPLLSRPWLVGELRLENEPPKPKTPLPPPPADEGGDDRPSSPPPEVPFWGVRSLVREGGPPPPISVAARLTATAPGSSVC